MTPWSTLMSAVPLSISRHSCRNSIYLALLLCSITGQSSTQQGAYSQPDSGQGADPLFNGHTSSHRTHHHHGNHTGSHTRHYNHGHHSGSHMAQEARFNQGTRLGKPTDRVSLQNRHGEMVKSQESDTRYQQRYVNSRTGVKRPLQINRGTSSVTDHKITDSSDSRSQIHVNVGQTGHIAANGQGQVRHQVQSLKQPQAIDEHQQAQIPKPDFYQIHESQQTRTSAPDLIQQPRRLPKVQTKLISASISHGDRPVGRARPNRNRAMKDPRNTNRQGHNETELPQKDAIPIFGPPIVGQMPEASSRRVVKKPAKESIIENNIISNSIQENIVETNVKIKTSTEVTEPGLTLKGKTENAEVNKTEAVTEPGLTSKDISPVPATEKTKEASEKEKTAHEHVVPDNKTKIKAEERKTSTRKEHNKNSDNNVIRTCPYPCICRAKKLYCDKLMLTRVPRGIPLDTVNINIKENHIKRIHYKTLKGLRHLKHFLAKGNRIHSVQSKAFRDLHQLNSLSLTDNRIRHLSPQVLSPLYALQYLSLRMNKIKKIEGLLTNNRELKLLNLGSNRIRKITEHTFKSNTLLRVLDLHNNSITHLHKDAFTWMPYLKFLVLRDNPLKSAEFNFKFNFHLELLDFTNCRLTEIMKGLPYSINDLRLSENSIKELKPEDFQNTRRIRLLVLNKNNITRIQDDTFANLTYLYDVYLSHNRLKKLPTIFPNSVHALYVNHNNLTFIGPDSFKNSTKMEMLMLKWNQIREVAQNAFRGLSVLRSLDLSNNEIKDVKPRTFSALHGLEILDLSNNPIERLSHDCFSGLGNLNVLQMSSIGSQAKHKNLPAAVFKALRNLLFLDLSNSSVIVRHLAENPYVLDYLHSLEDLNLMNSALYGLPSNFPSHFPYLKVVKLVGNPWHCDRSIYWMTKWMKNRDVSFFSRDNMVCASPPKMKGKRIADITRNQLPTIAPPPTYKPKVKPIDIPFQHVTRKNVTVQLNLTEKQMGRFAKNNAGGTITTEDYPTTGNEQAAETTGTEELSTLPNAPFNSSLNETEEDGNFTRRELLRENGQTEAKRLKWFKSSEFKPFKKWIEPMPDNSKILNATRINFIKARFNLQQGQEGSKVKRQDELGSGAFSGEPEPTKIDQLYWNTTQTNLTTIP